MSQSRRPPMGAMGGGYPPQGGPYMGQQMPPMGPGPGPQRFMMSGQMPSQMYPGQQQMYPMPPSQQPPGPPVSPASRPLTPQQSQLQQMQNMVSNSPKQPSPAPSVSSDHGSNMSVKQEDGQDTKSEPGNPDDRSGDNSRGSRLAPSPVGSTGSRSNTPASIPGGQAGSPMPVRPPSGQIDGSNRMTQSPMATQGYNQQMMPPPNSMGYMPGSGKMVGQIPGHYPQYNSQFPQGNYPRQQPGMGGMGGPSGPMQNYPGSQPNMYPNGPGQMPGAMYGNMPGMSRNMSQPGYPSGAPFGQGPGSMMNSQYPGYPNSHMGPMPGQHGMPPQQQTPGSGMPPGSSSGPLPPTMASQSPGSAMIPQHGSHASNKAAQAAQAAMLAAASTTGSRISSRGSPSRGMFQQPGQNSGASSGGPLAQMNNMTNSPNFGSPSLNSMSNAVEQLGRGSLPPSSSTGMGGAGIPASTPSPVPKSSHSPAATIANNLPSSIAHGGANSPLSTVDTQEPSRPSSAAHPSDLAHTGDTTSSDSSSGMPSDSTSVDSGFHSSDQGDKTSDSMSTPTQSVPSPIPQSGQANGESAPRTLENISPPNQASHHPHLHPPHHPNHPNLQHMGMDPNKMPYSNDGSVPLPPSSISSNAMSSMPSSTGTVVTTAATGPLSTSVTQSIASPVTSVSTSLPHHSHPHPSHQQHMGPHGGSPHPMMGHSMGPGGHSHPGMMPNGMMNPNHMGGPGQHMPPNMQPGMMPNMGGPNMSMNQNGSMMGPNGPMMGHNGPMMPPGMNNSGNMPPMGLMPHHPHSQQPQQQPQMNNMPMVNQSNGPPEDQPPPEKKKKSSKDMDGLPPSHALNRAGLAGAHYSEEPNSPGALKSSSDLSKLFELGTEPDRRPFLERILSFLEESGQPVTACPVISKTPLDLYKLYFSVRDKGGFVEVNKGKKWREICTVVNIGTSASAAFTLKKNYIKYLFNYECKFDRGGINPAPILAQMEATLAQKREQKSKTRAPSPGSNSNDAFRPPSNSNSGMDSSFPPNMPPPYMANPDGSMGNHHMGGGNMMMPNNMMSGPGHHGPMMGPPGMGPNMMGGPGMMPGQPGMMGGPQMMPGGSPGGPPGYGGPMMSQQPMTSQTPSNSNGPVPGAPQVSTSGPVTSDSVSVQDPFSDEPNYHHQGRAGPQATPPPQMSSPAPPTSSGGSQQSSPAPPTMTSSVSRSEHTAGYSGARPSDSNSSGSSGMAGPFPYGQQFERPDRFDQSSPSMGLRPPGPNQGMAPGQQAPGQPGESGAPMYHGPRFPGPQGSMIRPSGDGPGQFPPGMYQGQGPYPGGPQYSGYSQSPGGFPGPRPPYGTPNKRYPDEHGPDMMGSQWSPIQRSRGGAPGYMPPGPPSTPPMGPFNRQMPHRNSPQAREQRYNKQQGQKPAYAGPPPPTKKELTFPSDCVEGVHIATTKRKRMTNKDLAPFEAWRLMLALKSGLLAESTWALDTMNIMLYDDATYSYFSLGTLPGLLEVLTEHFRQCLIQMFDGFQELEIKQSRRQRHNSSKQRQRTSSSVDKTPDDIVKELTEHCINNKGDVEPVRMFQMTGPNFTKMSRKGLPVKYDTSPSDISVLESKDWDIYTHFDTKPDHWLTGGGDITDHIFTHLESQNTNSFLANKFRKKRSWDTTKEDIEEVDQKSKKVCKSEANDVFSIKEEFCSSDDNIDSQKGSKRDTSSKASSEDNPCLQVYGETNSKSNMCFNIENNHSSACNGSEKTVVSHNLDVKEEPKDHYFQQSVDVKENENKINSILNSGVDNSESTSKNVEPKQSSPQTELKESSVKKVPIENGDIEEPKLSPMVNCQDDVPSNESSKSFKEKCESKDGEIDCSNSSPPVLKAECFDRDEERVNSSTNKNGLSTNSLDNCVKVEIKNEKSAKNKKAAFESTSPENISKASNKCSENRGCESISKASCNFNSLNISETEELSANIVAELSKIDEHMEDEAFQRDDPPLSVTPESKDELGRRCVCISNIFRSLTYVPGNEIEMCKHPGMMRLLGRLLLLHHSHPQRPEPRKLPSGETDTEEDEREEPPRVYDTEHWWWDYLDQLRENTLVILANICGHLKLSIFTEEVCKPLLEGLLHWVICPASVARDPMPTLSASSQLSPQRLVLEALCKLCIQDQNVDLLLATPPIRRLLEVFSVLVHLLADRNQPITREFSIVLLSFLVPGDSSAARGVALQHPCVSLLVDFLETAEQNALAIANQQGLEVLQSNPEIMGTSLDMLRRAASILLHMARVPDNRKLFVAQQPRLLNLVMSQILDQTVSNTLSEVLFECSQCS